jgi:hypothetical protein
VEVGEINGEQIISSHKDALPTNENTWTEICLGKSSNPTKKPVRKKSEIFGPPESQVENSYPTES